MNKLKKDDALRKMELKKLKEENGKLTSEIGKLQLDKDRIEAKVKADEKLEKIKRNTQRFNKIIEKQIEDGEIVDIDISIYQNNKMEECDGGETSRKTTGYGPADLKNLIKNKNSGGRRTNPQENSEVKKNEKRK